MKPTKRVDTVKINTKQGKKDYAQVKDRLQGFHEDVALSESGFASIKTKTNFNPEMTKACVHARIKMDRGIYDGQAFGYIGLEDSKKNLEKLETVAVGRALANAGYDVDGGIASYEEMQNWKARQAPVEKDQLEEIHKVALQTMSEEEWSENLGKALTYYEVDDLYKLTQSQADHLLDNLEARKTKPASLKQEEVGA